MTDTNKFEISLSFELKLGIGLPEGLKPSAEDLSDLMEELKSEVAKQAAGGNSLASIFAEAFSSAAVKKTGDEPDTDTKLKRSIIKSAIMAFGVDPKELGLEDLDSLTDTELDERLEALKKASGL